VSNIRTYLLNFYAAGVNMAALHQYIIDSKEIRAYWNYIPFVYGIKSTLSSSELSSKFRPFFPNGNYLITEIFTLNVDGVMPHAAWSWFYYDPDVPTPVQLSLGEALLALGGPDHKR
jgi:hypothetical protein